MVNGKLKMENSKWSFLKDKIFWLMLFIIVLGTILRLLFIDKPDGLWNDEYLSWQIASIPLGQKFVHEVISQCHMPFYYLYLKFFVHFFGNSDLMLRLTSVPVGLLSIIVMYFVGKELKDEKLGILTAVFTSLSSFLIYFSQEVRFYELLFLFSSLSLLYTLRLAKNQNTQNTILYIISNLFIIFTHTLGFVFVIFNMAFMSFWVIKKQNERHPELVSGSHIRRFLKIFWSISFLIFIAFIPLAAKTFSSHPLSQWWGIFSMADIGFFFTDYFSPVLTNIVSAPDNFFYNFNFSFILFAIVPSIIAITGIVNVLLKKKDSICYFLFAICLSYIIFLVILALTGKLLFITKYSMEVYPVLILLACSGLSELKPKWSNVLIFLFCSLSLFYLLRNPQSAPRIRRSEGHKIVADLLKNSDLKKGDMILINYYPIDRFEKYFNFNNYQVISFNKGNFKDYLGIESNQDFKNINNKFFAKKFQNEILNNLKSGQKLAIVILNDVSIYSPVQMKLIEEDNKVLTKTPLLFLAFSQFKNEILAICLKHLSIQRMEQKGSWSVVIFQK